LVDLFIYLFIFGDNMRFLSKITAYGDDDDLPEIKIKYGTGFIKDLGLIADLYAALK
jgi:hypothetical protein